VKPPALDPVGKDQRKPALAPDQRTAYDPETKGMYLETVKGDLGPAGEKNEVALRPDGKQTRRRKLLTQQILSRLAAGESVIDIADTLDVATSTVTAHVARHRREVEVAQIDGRLDEIAVPLATDNLIHGLIAGDKDYTLETLKGRGKFRRHTEDTGAGKLELPVLRIAIEVNTGAGPSPLTALPIPSADQMIAGGRIVGAMRLPKPALPDIPVPHPEVPDAVQIAGTPRTPTKTD
jgi:hypothetical protein